MGFLVLEGVLIDPRESSNAKWIMQRGLLGSIGCPSQRSARVLERKGMLTSGCAGGMVFSVVGRRGLGTKRYRLKVLCRIIERMGGLEIFPGPYSITPGVHAGSLANSSRTIMILGRIGAAIMRWTNCGPLFSEWDRYAVLVAAVHRTHTLEVLVKAARSGFHRAIPGPSQRDGRGYGKTKPYRRRDLCAWRQVHYFDHGGAELIED